jgi:hypothetical protein
MQLARGVIDAAIAPRDMGNAVVQRQGQQWQTAARVEKEREAALEETYQTKIAQPRMRATGQVAAHVARITALKQDAEQAGPAHVEAATKEWIEAIAEWQAKQAQVPIVPNIYTRHFRE